MSQSRRNSDPCLSPFSSSSQRKKNLKRLNVSQKFEKQLFIAQPVDERPKKRKRTTAKKEDTEVEERSRRKALKKEQDVIDLCSSDDEEQVKNNDEGQNEKLSKDNAAKKKTEKSEQENNIKKEEQNMNATNSSHSWQNGLERLSLTGSQQETAVSKESLLLVAKESPNSKGIVQMDENENLASLVNEEDDQDMHFSETWESTPGLTFSNDQSSSPPPALAQAAVQTTPISSPTANRVEASTETGNRQEDIDSDQILDSTGHDDSGAFIASCLRSLLDLAKQQETNLAPQSTSSRSHVLITDLCSEEINANGKGKAKQTESRRRRSQDIALLERMKRNQRGETVCHLCVKTSVERKMRCRNTVGKKVCENYCCRLCYSWEFDDMTFDPDDKVFLCKDCRPTKKKKSVQKKGQSNKNRAGQLKRSKFGIKTYTSAYKNQVYHASTSRKRLSRLPSRVSQTFSDEEEDEENEEEDQGQASICGNQGGRDGLANVFAQFEHHKSQWANPTNRKHLTNDSDDSDEEIIRYNDSELSEDENMSDASDGTVQPQVASTSRVQL